MKTKELKLSYKSAININKTIYSYGIEKSVELETGDDEEKIKKKLWNEIINEVENQIELIYK